MRATCLMATLLGALLAVWPDWVRAEEQGQQKACELNRTVAVTMKYLLYLPKDYREKPSWPLLLFLHGSGERGDDLALVKKHGPPKLIEAGHDSWTESYANPQFYDWLLQQKRPGEVKK